MNIVEKCIWVHEDVMRLIASESLECLVEFWMAKSYQIFQVNCITCEVYPSLKLIESVIIFTMLPWKVLCGLLNIRQPPVSATNPTSTHFSIKLFPTSTRVLWIKSQSVQHTGKSEALLNRSEALFISNQMQYITEESTVEQSC